MKRLIVVALMLCIFYSSKAQVTVPEPEFIGQVVVLTSDSTGVLLNKEKPSLKAKSNGVAYIPIPGASLLSKTKTSIVLNGTSSNTKVASDTVRFIIKLENREVDPTSTVHVMKFDVKKKTREAVVADFGLLNGFNYATEQSETYTVTKYGESSVLFTLNSVSEGEYGICNVPIISAIAFSEMSTFGVDPEE